MPTPPIPDDVLDQARSLDTAASAIVFGENPAAERFADWAIVELMGHRRLAGYLSEIEIAGKGFLRLDVPGEVEATQLYNPAAVYAITPTSEETARQVAALSRPAPVSRWELPAAPPEPAERPF
jgi:hypothetical protein